MSSVIRSPLSVRLSPAIERACDALFKLQRPDGSWEGELSPSAPATADVVIAIHLADRSGSRDLIDSGVSWLLLTQNDDGGWGDDVDTESTLNGTVLSVAALALAAPEKTSDAVRRGWKKVEELGGVSAVRDVEQCSLAVLAHFYLALARLVSSKSLLRVPVELALLPAPLRRKLTFAMPTAMAWGLMCARIMRSGPIRSLINRMAMPKALRYLDGLVQYEGPQGGFVESAMMSANVCIGLTLARQRPNIVQHCLNYFRATIKDEGAWSVTRDLEVDATNFVTAGLQYAGFENDPRVNKAVQWIRSAQRDEEFIWTGAPPGGWGWGIPSGWPNAGNTGGALMALGNAGYDISDSTVESGTGWLLRQQNYDGSWSCFARVGRVAAMDPSFAMVGKARSPKVLYGACTVMSAEALSALGRCGNYSSGDADIVQAYSWLDRVQHDDGAFDNKWYLGRVAGTGSVLRALTDVQLADSPVAGRCVSWLRLNQNRDGGWGEGLGACISTVEETAMAMVGLTAAYSDPTDPMLARGASWLLDQQGPDGLWQPSLVGVYFLELLYRHDHTANGYALQALAQYQNLLVPKNTG